MPRMKDLTYGVRQDAESTAVLVRVAVEDYRYVWPKPNTTTRECQHVDLGICRRCASPMDPQGWADTRRVLHTKAAA